MKTLYRLSQMAFVCAMLVFGTYSTTSAARSGSVDPTEAIKDVIALLDGGKIPGWTNPLFYIAAKPYVSDGLLKAIRDGGRNAQRNHENVWDADIFTGAQGLIRVKFFKASVIKVGTDKATVVAVIGTTDEDVIPTAGARYRYEMLLEGGKWKIDDIKSLEDWAKDFKSLKETFVAAQQSAASNSSASKVQPFKLNPDDGCFRYTGAAEQFVGKFKAGSYISVAMTSPDVSDQSTSSASDTRTPVMDAPDFQTNNSETWFGPLPESRKYTIEFMPRSAFGSEANVVICGRIQPPAISASVEQANPPEASRPQNVVTESDGSLTLAAKEHIFGLLREDLIAAAGGNASVVEAPFPARFMDTGFFREAPGLLLFVNPTFGAVALLGKDSASGEIRSHGVIGALEFVRREGLDYKADDAMKVKYGLLDEALNRLVFNERSRQGSALELLKEIKNKPDGVNNFLLLSGPIMRSADDDVRACFTSLDETSVARLAVDEFAKASADAPKTLSFFAADLVPGPDQGGILVMTDQQTRTVYRLFSVKREGGRCSVGDSVTTVFAS